jgi:mannose/fructose/N-acetylgalactosamine-specific phosphotransferase system component IIC
MSPLPDAILWTLAGLAFLISGATDANHRLVVLGVGIGALLGGLSLLAQGLQHQARMAQIERRTQAAIERREAWRARPD